VSTVDAGFKQKGHYGLSKAQAEQRIIDSGLAYTILRPTVIYGPNDNFISNLLKMIHRLPVIPVLGDGRYLRQPIYIDDVVRTIEKVLEQENGQNKIYHLAGPQAHSMLEIIDIIQKGLSTRKWKVYLPLIPTRIILFSCAKLFRLRAFPREQIANIEMDKIADITGLTEELSIYPINLREGLNKLIGGKNGN
jgi:NADH dehydrogenase